MSEPLSISLNTPFFQAIKAAQNRGVVLPELYYSAAYQGIARQLAFSIAGITSLDQLTVVRDSLAAALQSGESLATWRKNILESGTLDLPKYRLNTIFRTNIQSNYNRGRWQRFEAVKATRPYLMLDAINDNRVRPAHLALDGIIRPVDDPFWNTHSPSLGFNCRCRLISMSEAQAKARSGDGKGLNKPIDLEAMQPDKGWDYNPGKEPMEGIKRAINNKQSQCNGTFTALAAGGKSRYTKPIWCHGDGENILNMLSVGLDIQKEMPPPKQVDFQVFDKGKDDRFYLTQFMQQFGAAYNEQVIVEAKTGLHQLLVSDELFSNHKSGDSKITKHGREQYVLHIADTILNPAEIWLKTGKYEDNALYFLSRFLIKKDIMNVLAVFRQTGKVWTGWTGYQNFRSDYFESKRDGALIYRND
jgi:SPP1 gp7 family putative phage head morphogenesis protein